MATRRPRDPDQLRDVDIQVAPLRRSDGTEIEQKVTALGLFKDMQDGWTVHADRRYPQSTLNERFIAGEQQWGIESKRGASELIVDWPKWRGRMVTRNLMRNLHLTNVARVTKGDPSVSAWAGDGSNSDLAASDVGNALIYSMRNAQDHRKRISRGAWTAGAQGTVAFYTTWATDKGPVVNGQYLGDVEAAVPIQVFDWMTDGAEDIEDSECCAVRRWMRPKDAYARLLAVGVQEEPKEQLVKTIWGEGGDQRVEAWEYWHKPCERIPKGLFIMLVGGHVVNVMDFPYEHGELPLAIWKWVDVPDSPHGGTPADDAVPIQRTLNDRHSDLSIITQKSARWLMLITTKEIQRQVKADPTSIGVDDVSAINATKIIGAPPPPALIYTQIEEAERMLREVYGVNEAVSGSDTSQMKNARMMAYTTELDGQKLASTIVARDHAMLRVYRQALGLWRQFVDQARTIKVMGNGGLPQMLSFSGADLNGVDVYLEPTSGSDHTRPAQALDAEQASAAGFMDPRKGAELRQSGQAMTREDMLSRTLVQRQIQDAAGGFAAQADPSVSPMIAVSEIGLALEQAGSNEAMAQPLMALLAQYQQMMTQSQQPTGTPQEVAPEQAGIT
jgi:hypothetical protein